YFRTTPFPADQTFPDEEATLRAFADLMDESKQLATNITYMVELADFQVLPGVFDFALIDRFMDMATDKGFTVTIRLAHMERLYPYLWQPYTLPRNFDGSALRGHASYGSYDVTDAAYVASWTSGFRAIYDRYQKHPAFEGYYVMQAGGEWAIPDEPWNGFIAGYSWASTRAFRAYLRDTLKLDLPALNQRWGTSYREWTEVVPPAPILNPGNVPDLRPAWIDFCRCKQSWKDDWFPQIAASIRAYDNTRVIIAYNDSRGVEKIYGLVDYLHNGGNDYLEGEGTLVDAWEKGRVGWITEPHHPHYWAAANDPGGRGWILDWSLYVMTAQAGGGGQNLHVYYVPYKKSVSLASHYGFVAAHDRYELFKPITRELHGTRLLEPAKKVAVMQTEDTLHAKHRTTFTSRLMDLRRWFELVRTDSLDYEFYRADHEANYRMVVINPLDEVMSAESISAVRRMAENGAWIVTSARSGYYSAERGMDQSFALLERLGISKPAGRYDTVTRGVLSTLKPAQTLLPGRSTVPFVSQTDIAADMIRPEVAKNFWNWPYRWIPQSDYFGYYSGNTGVNGEVLATFPDGGAAISRHSVGKGTVIVFWGTASAKHEDMAGVMASIAKAAGVVDERGPRPIPLMLQARRDDLDRHYAIIYNEKPGSYQQPISELPDGEWFVDDMVTGRRYGLVDAAFARKEGIPLKFEDGESPLKVLRFITLANMGNTAWRQKYGRIESPTHSGK
ncbi:MAG: beta-galactosidase, partial [Rariglobus sp.]